MLANAGIIDPLIYDEQLKGAKMSGFFTIWPYNCYIQ